MGDHRGDQVERHLGVVVREVLRQRAQFAEVLDRLERIERALGRPEWITAAELARRRGVTAEYVRRNADKFDVRREGDGPRPRLWFPASAADLSDPMRSDAIRPTD
jgi:hypothetical protein